MVVMPDHEREWIRFGDFVWMDGTRFSKPLGWILIPITLCHASKGLACGGWIVAAVETEEMYRWVLEQLISISEQLRGSRFATLFIDEDQAQIQAARALEVPFCLCSRHKLENFEKQIAQLNLDAAVSEQAENLYFRIIHTRDELVQQEAIYDLNQLLPQLEAYLTVEIYGLLPNLAELQRQGVPTLGYTTTGLAESTNSLVKRCFGDRQVAFVDLPQRITFAFVYRQLNQQDRIVRTQRASCRLGVPLAPWLEFEIARVMKQGAHWRIVARDEADPLNPIYSLRHHKHDWNVVFTTASSCSCGRPTALLRPCKHIALVYRLAGRNYPVHLINERWYEEPLATPVVDGPSLELLDLIDASRAPSPCTSGDDDEELRGVWPSAGTGNDVARYKKVFYIGKQLAASLPDGHFEELVERLQALVPEFKPGEVDLGDAVPVRKGRPPSTRCSALRPSLKCEIRGGAHLIRKCQHFPIFKLKAAEGVDAGEGRACGLCHRRGHTRSKCPSLSATRSELGLA
jgi:hypothetical protein